MEDLPIEILQRISEYLDNKFIFTMLNKKFYCNMWVHRCYNRDIIFSSKLLTTKHLNNMYELRFDSITRDTDFTLCETILYKPKKIPNYNSLGFSRFSALRSLHLSYSNNINLFGCNLKRLKLNRCEKITITKCIVEKLILTDCIAIDVCVDLREVVITDCTDIHGITTQKNTMSWHLREMHNLEIYCIDHQSVHLLGCSNITLISNAKAVYPNKLFSLYSDNIIIPDHIMFREFQTLNNSISFNAEKLIRYTATNVTPYQISRFKALKYFKNCNQCGDFEGLHHFEFCYREFRQTKLLTDIKIFSGCYDITYIAVIPIKTLLDNLSVVSNIMYSLTSETIAKLFSSNYLARSVHNTISSIDIIGSLNALDFYYDNDVIKMRNSDIVLEFKKNIV